jgi:hypothetical protein
MANNRIYIEEFGILELFDIFMEYEHPMIFVCKDVFGTLYLFSEEGIDPCIEEWLVIKITNSRYQELISNKISIQNAYRQNTESKIYWVSHSVANDKYHLEIKKSLPQQSVTPFDSYVGDFRELKEEAFPEIKEIARTSDSAIVEIVLYPEEKLNGINIDTHQAVMKSIDSLLKVCYGGKHYQSRILPAKAASYVMRISVANEPDLFENYSEKVVKEFHSLVSLDTTTIEKATEENDKKVVKLKELLTAVEKTKAPVVFNTSETVSVMLDSEGITEGTKMLSHRIKEFNQKKVPTERIIELDGVIDGYDLDKRKFSFIKDKQRINGDLSPELSMDCFVGNDKLYHVLIKETKLVAGKNKCTLLSFQALNP